MAKRKKKNARRRSKRGFGTQLKKVLLLVLVGLLLAVPIPFVNTMAGYMPLLAYVFVLLISYVYLRLLRENIVFEQGGIGEGCLRGEKLAFKLTVENKSPLPAVSINALFFISDLFGGERESVRQRISLPPHSKKEFDFAVSFDHIGSYTVGIKQIEVTDPFGIFSHAKTNDELCRVFVQPRIFDVASIELSTEASQESKRTLTTTIDDGMDYCGVREYRWGDPIKSIHWKLSARVAEGDYFTRLYETSCNPGIEVFIDFDSLDYTAIQLMDVYDAVVESALSIEAWGGALGYETKLLFTDDAGQDMCCEGPLVGQHAELVRLMPRIEPGDGLKLIDLLCTEASSIYSQNNLIVCSACVTDELIGELISVQAQRKTPILFAVVPSDAEEDELAALRRKLARLSAADIAYTVFNTADELGGRG